MCGIAGVYFFKNFQDALPHQSVLNALRHRGPDGQQLWIQNPVIYYHSRLSIIGLGPENNQPLKYDNALLTFNGEIFNYKQLSVEMGEPLNNDARFLIRWFKANGINGLKKCNGFFAFSFYNASTGDFFLVRDRAGVKPLYYYLDNEKCCFASEIRTLLHLAGKGPLNFNALYDYFRFNYIPGNQTIFRHIQSLPPGHFLQINPQKKISIIPWYELTPEKSSTDPRNFINLMKDAVSLRMVSDVPVGGFLSGGLDSAIVCGLASQIQPGFKTFTLGFNDQTYYNEIHTAEKTAQHFRMDHTVILTSFEEFTSLLPEFFNSTDQPFADSSALNLFMLSRKISGKIKVILSGDGADELFKGYKKHSALKWASLPLALPAFKLLHYLLFPLKGSRNSSMGNLFRQIHRMGKLSFYPPGRIVGLMEFQDVKDFEKCLNFTSTIKNNIPDFLHPLPPYAQLSLSDFADLYYVLQNDMLVKTDRYSMWHGLEIRNPFLDYRIMEFAMGLPEEQKISLTKRKIFLRQTFEDFIPDHLKNGPKKGFEIPLSRWLPLWLSPDVFQKKFNEEKIRHQNFFHFNDLEKLYSRFHKNPSPREVSLWWALWIFQEWADHFEPWIEKTEIPYAS